MMPNISLFLNHCPYLWSMGIILFADRLMVQKQWLADLGNVCNSGSYALERIRGITKLQTATLNYKLGIVLLLLISWNMGVEVFMKLSIIVGCEDSVPKYKNRPFSGWCAQGLGTNPWVCELSLPPLILCWVLQIINDYLSSTVRSSCWVRDVIGWCIRCV